MQTLIDLGEPRQNGLTYPQPLEDKYQPKRIQDFIGLELAKPYLQDIINRPRPTSILLVGPPGTGKTSLGLALADELPGTLHHLSSQRCDVATLDRLRDNLMYYPGRGKFHVVLIDEANGMTDKAQFQLLSQMDSAAALKPKFGGGFERGTLPPVIRIFTSNGLGPEQTEAPRSFEPRFLSRCRVLPCPKPAVIEVQRFLEEVWLKEGGDPSADLSYLAESCDGIRDGLTKIEVALITGLPKRPAPAAPAMTVERAPKPRNAEPKGRICYIAKGRPDPDPDPTIWEFRKVTALGSRMFMRRAQ